MAGFRYWYRGITGLSTGSTLPEKKIRNGVSIDSFINTTHGK
jgi:hypothetical protein